MRFSDKSILYIGSNLAGSVLQLIASMVMVRYLLKYDYGTIRQIMLLAVVVPTSIALGLPQSLSYFIPRSSSSKEKKQFALQVFILMVFLGTVAAIASYLLRAQISKGFSNPDLVSFAWIFSLYFLFLVPSACAKATLLSLGRTSMASMLHLGTVIVNFLFVVVPLILGYDLQVILLSMLGVYGIKFVVVLCILLSLDGGFPKPLDWSSLKAQINYSLPIWLAALMGTLRTCVDKFLVAFLYRPETFAIYSRGSFELPLVAMVPYALGSLLTPRFAEMYSRGDVLSIIRLWQEAMSKIAQLFFPVFVFTFIFADQIITLMFTSEYSGSVGIFRIYLCLLPIRLAAYRTILTAVGETKPILSSTSISFVASALLGIALETAFGLSGPAFGIVTGEVLGVGYMLWRSKEALNVSWLDLIPLQKLAPPLCVSVIVGIVIFPLYFVDQVSAAFVGIYAAFYFGLYIVLMRIFRFFTEEDWALIRRIVSLELLKQQK